jgi:hypothetical protein
MEAGSTCDDALGQTESADLPVCCHFLVLVLGFHSFFTHPERLMGIDLVNRSIQFFNGGCGWQSSNSKKRKHPDDGDAISVVEGSGLPEGDRVEEGKRKGQKTARQ